MSINTLESFNFYTSLIGVKLNDTLRAGLSHVVVFGSITGHAKGPRGCIASNEHISEEVGLSEGRTANIISELNQAGWIRVNLNELRQRTSIDVMIGLHLNGNPVSQNSETPFHGNVNIDNSKEITVVDKEYKEKNKLAKIEKSPEELELYQYWNEAFGFKAKYTAAERRAIKKLLAQYPLDRIKVCIQFAALGRGEQYCPVITSFAKLEDKWHNMEAHIARKVGQQNQVNNRVADLSNL